MKAFSALVLAQVVAGQLIWPSEWDELEAIYTMMSGYNRRGFIDAVNPCTFGTNVPGRQNAAEWIRTAFHDMATHDAEAGAGGIDASIFFELERAENVGAAFNNTFAFFSGYYNIRASASDLIALGVVTATDACRGPQIPLRGGRKDAKEAGPAGVPEPQTDLDTTLATFETAGFNQQDMIAMVACGHALGGVHSVDFPDLVEIPADPDNDTSVPFQSDRSLFQKGVVTEFLDDSTKNPLVVAANDTLNSDKRIFESDGRKTMEELAKGDNFQTMCADIFSRMIDTVPSTVTLSDVIKPYDVKPTIAELSLDENGNLKFNGDIRLRTTGGIRDANDLAVKLVYTGSDGESSTKHEIETRRATFQGGMTGGLHGETFITFTFDATIDGKLGISNFLIHETVISSNTTTIHDNQGTGGYPVQDTLLHQPAQGCTGDYSDGGIPITVAAVVRKGNASESLRLDVVHQIPRQGVIVPELTIESINFDKVDETKGDWVTYQAKATILDSTTFDIILEGDEGISVPFIHTATLRGSCSN